MPGELHLAFSQGGAYPASSKESGCALWPHSWGEARNGLPGVRPPPSWAIRVDTARYYRNSETSYAPGRRALSASRNGHSRGLWSVESGRGARW